MLIFNERKYENNITKAFNERRFKYIIIVITNALYESKFIIIIIKYE